MGYYGRGGAGNYRDTSVIANHEDGKIAKEVQENMQQDVTKYVEERLQEPEKAHLGGERAA